MAMNPRLLRPLGTGFNPKKIASLGAWFDATDLSTLSQTSDGTTPVTANDDPVAYWEDKVTGEAMTMTVDANRPLWKAAGLNGRRTLNFDGSNDFLTSNAAPIANLLRNISGATVFKVCHLPADQNATLLLFTTPNSGLARVLQRRQSATGWSLLGRRLDADTSVNVTGGAHVSAPIIFRNFADFQNTTVRLAVNAAEVASSTSFQTAGNTSDTASARVSFGGSTSDGITVTTPLNGAISEVIIYRRALTTAEIARVEGYLAKKWGITL
jgi:hypothetical protein